MPLKNKQLELTQGELIDDRYQTDSELGRGGMGRIYLAHQRPFDRPVVIKVMRQKFVSNEEHRQRFFNEARAASQLSHPNTITVFDFGKTENGLHFIAMEYVDGTTLREVIDDHGPLPLDRVVPIIIQTAQSLGEAHRKGIIHRDLKPENIMLGRPGTSDEFVKVLDFGIAKLADAKTEIDEKDKVIGTPAYMSPEQGRGDEVDPTADLYALSCCFYEMLSGQRPFIGETRTDTMIKHQTEPVPPLPDSVPPRIRDFIDAGLAKHPGDRPATADDYVARLLGSLRGAMGRETPADTGAEQPSGADMMRQTPAPTPPPADRSSGVIGQAETAVTTAAEMRERNTSQTSGVSGAESPSREIEPSAPEPAASTRKDSNPLGTGIQQFSGPDEPESVTQPDASTQPETSVEPQPEPQPEPPTERRDSSPSGLKTWAITASATSALLTIAILALIFSDIAGDPSEVLIDSKPSEAIVEVNGKEIGLTPIPYSAQPGERLTIEIRRVGHETETVSHRVSDDPAARRVFAVLERRQLQLSVESPIEGMQLTINGELHGTLAADRPRSIEVEWPYVELVIRMTHSEYKDYLVRFPASTLDETRRVAPARADFVRKTEIR